MGGSSSRLDSQSPHRGEPTLSSYFSCGCGIPSLFICGAGAPSQIEDDPAELLANSSEHCSLDKFRNPGKDSARSSNAGSGSTSAESQARGSDNKIATASVIPQSRDGPSDETSSSEMGQLFGSGRLFPHCQSDRHNIQTSSLLIHKEENCPNSSSKDTCRSLTHNGTSLFHELAETSSDGSSNGIQGTAVMAFSNLSSSTTSNISDSQFSNCTSRTGSGLNSIESEGGLVRREENPVFGDVASISSSEVSGTSSLMDKERRNRRLFGDTLSRRSRGYHGSRNNLFSNNNSGNLGPHGRWLNDLSSNFLGEGVGGILRPYENGARGNSNRQWHSTSEILGITCGALDNNGPRTTTCLSGIHPRGPCSCEHILRGESFGSRASISRVVMLAEALFEVLDDVHWQPQSGPLPVVSVPAEESVVNSLPTRNYKKPEELVCSDDALKCYICLDEYENGDNIRILPCRHEYHVSCIDKWLKGIHRVCPLCRADVNDGFIKSSIST